MKKRYIKIAALVALFASLGANAQQGFGTSTPAPSSVVDMVAGDKGALLPRVVLTSTTVAAPVTAPVNGLTVFNINTAGDVTPGYYYYNTALSKWVRLLDTNLYNADGTLTADRTVTMDGRYIQFTDAASTGFTTFTGATQSIYNATTNGRASLQLQAGTSPFNIFVDGGNHAQITTGSPTEATPLSITTIGAAPLLFSTNSNQRAIITSDGNMGINAPVPSNMLHVASVADPVRLEGMQAGTVGTDKIMVANATGVLKTIPAGTQAIRVIDPATFGATEYTLAANDHTVILSGIAASNSFTFKLPQASTCPGKIYYITVATSTAAITGTTTAQRFSSYDGAALELKASLGTIAPIATYNGSNYSAGSAPFVTNHRTIWQSDGSIWWLIGA